VPFEWAPVLTYIQKASPYIREGKILKSTDYIRKDIAVHYGAAVGALEALLSSYFLRVKGFDRTHFCSNPWQQGLSTADQMKLGCWTQAEVNEYYRGSESVVINTLEGKTKGTKKYNRKMMGRLSALMRGFIRSPHDEDIKWRSMGSTEGLTMASKIEMPLDENLYKFAGCYPFVIAFVCRTLDNTCIIIKIHDSEYDDHEEVLKVMMAVYGNPKVGSRFIVVYNEDNLRQVLRLKMAGQISELLMHFDRLNSNWRKPLMSNKNRSWFLAGPQMPNLFRPPELAMDIGSVLWPYDGSVIRALRLEIKQHLKEEKVKKIPKNKKNKKRGDGEKLQEYSDSIVNF